jgi:hypothetical protein
MLESEKVSLYRSTVLLICNIFRLASKLCSFSLLSLGLLFPALYGFSSFLFFFFSLVFWVVWVNGTEVTINRIVLPRLGDPRSEIAGTNTRWSEKAELVKCLLAILQT